MSPSRCLGIVAVIVAFSVAAPAAWGDADGDARITMRHKAKRMEHTGEWLSGVGIAHLAAAIPLAIVLSLPEKANCGCGGNGILFLPTVGIGALGVALLASGLPLWLIGHHRHMVIDRAPAPVTAALGANQLQLRF